MIDPAVFAASSAILIVLAFAIASLRPAAIVDHPRAVLLLLGLATLGAAAALIRLDPPGLRIDVNASSQPLLPANDPGQAVYRQASLDFGSDDIYVIAIETDDVFRATSLRTLRSISNEIQALPGVRGTDSLVDAYSYTWENEIIEIGRFITRIPDDAAALADLRRRALDDPIYTKTLVSADGRAAAINVSFKNMSEDEFVKLGLDRKIREILNGHAADGLRFFVTGRPHIRTEAHHLLIHDMVLLIPIAIAVATLLLWIISGSPRGTLIPLASNLTSTFWVFGAMAAVGVDLTIITLALGPMLICVGAVYGVHVLARYEVIAADAADGRAAALECLEYTRTPVLMAGVTTCVGFAALLMADIPATTEFGAFAVFGVASVTLLSLTGVPAALAMLPLRDKHGEPLYSARTRLALRIRTVLDGLLRRIAHVNVSRPGVLLAGWGALALLAIALIPRIVVNTDYLMAFLPDSRVRQDFAQVNRLLTGAVPIFVVIHGDAEGTFREPINLKAAEELQGRLERLPGVNQVLSAVDLVKMANRILNEDRPEEARIPDSRGLIAEAIFTVPKEKLRPFANSDHSRINLIVRTDQLGSAAVRALEGRIRDTIEEMGLPAGLVYDVTGNTILINRSADGVAGNQGTQVGMAAAAIFLLVVAVFGSFRLGALAMLPNVIPVLLFFGILGAGAAPLSIPTSLIGCIALGIAVDDTVHFLVAYQRRRAEGMDPDDASRYCLEQVGRPMLTTSIMLVIGFLVITAASFATLREFGYLTSVTMAICIASDLALLPALVARLRI